MDSFIGGGSVGALVAAAMSIERKTLERRRAHRHADELKVKVENPAKWLIQESSDEN